MNAQTPEQQDDVARRFRGPTSRSIAKTHYVNSMCLAWTGRRPPTEVELEEHRQQAEWEEE
jgi:hypothetical protein